MSRAEGRRSGRRRSARFADRYYESCHRCSLPDSLNYLHGCVCPPSAFDVEFAAYVEDLLRQFSDDYCCLPYCCRQYCGPLFRKVRYCLDLCRAATERALYNPDDSESAPDLADSYVLEDAYSEDSDTAADGLRTQVEAGPHSWQDDDDIVAYPVADAQPDYDQPDQPSVLEDPADEGASDQPSGLDLPDRLSCLISFLSGGHVDALQEYLIAACPQHPEDASAFLRVAKELLQARQLQYEHVDSFAARLKNFCTGASFLPNELAHLAFSRGLLPCIQQQLWSSAAAKVQEVLSTSFDILVRRARLAHTLCQPAHDSLKNSFANLQQLLTTSAKQGASHHRNTRYCGGMCCAGDTRAP